MKFLLDENIPYDLMMVLEKAGHQAFHIKKLGKAGIKNGDVYALAASLEAWIITRDIDFASEAKFNIYKPIGIIYFGIKDTTVLNIVKTFQRILVTQDIDFLKPRLVKIYEDEIKILDCQ